LDVKTNLNFAGPTGEKIGMATFSHSLSLKNISFHYPNGHVALQNISMTIRKGQKIGIVGNSGEGKTSLLLIFLQLLKQTEGEILVDDAVIPDENSWRKLLGYVPQNPYIVDGTISENIAFGISSGRIDKSKILSIVDDLDLTELIQQLPDGIDSKIGERGAKLSGGQKQRLAIGRALYSDASILLLDEVTNQVHLSVELEIMKVLDRLSDRKKTIIMVTHRIADESFFDTIYRLEKGALYQQAFNNVSYTE
jgi:HlyD family secretion protein